MKKLIMAALFLSCFVAASAEYKSITITNMTNKPFVIRWPELNLLTQLKPRENIMKKTSASRFDIGIKHLTLDKSPT